MSKRKTPLSIIRARRVRLLAISLSLALNGLAIWALLATRSDLAPAIVAPAMDVVILPPAERTPPPPPAAVEPQSLPRSRPARSPAPVEPEVAPLLRAPAPAAVAAAPAPPAAPPAPTLEAGVARTLRRKTGCQQAKLLGLTEAEQQACQDAFAAGAKTAPLYPVISDKEKQIFDGTYCPPDDEWCLYRMGRGPYPGLISLLRKHHP